MIQDIAPHKMDNQFRAGIGLEENSPVLIFTGKKSDAGTDQFSCRRRTAGRSRIHFFVLG